ncbi:serine/threonine protein kinase [Brachybacterium saurashtrense]|uniref:Serine/threonine protein kinase n=1 Tax=Brachybacterium saurashtrense TaxID=556288 RepID=A0A345YPG2_9MICO|nr:serine/threonine protein kinase [Brachybacterium saurashtrense]AXK45814.1 serine/threonine protein kinase [Brachybacterium saurashtrense]RRR24833.1 serine/threonine protein kinase [Brachybacterium saurashtrense]
MTALLSLSASDLTPEELVHASGEVLARFDHRTQDSGNVSWLVSTPTGDLFAKSAGEEGPPPGASLPYLDRAARVELLRSATAIARSVVHPALARLRNVIETPQGPVLVYDSAPGELVGVPAEHREDPDSAYRRFAASSPRLRLAVFDQLLDAHRALESEGWVACDLYDGCLMVDLTTGRLTLIDLDTYRRGPSLNDMGRMFGSSRFMAPEECALGAPLDAPTTVFSLGRLLRHFGTGLCEDLARFCGGDATAAVVERATRTDREERFADVAELVAAWGAARSGGTEL